jgi:hypothetical protein
MKLPVIITLIILVIVIYLFATIKQTEVVCDKTVYFDSDIRLTERVVSVTDGKKISSLEVTKTIVLPEEFTKDDSELNSIKYALENTLSYLGDKVKYTIADDRLIVKIKVDKNEVVLLDNIEFTVNETIEVKINSNTKSSDVIALAVGDSYTDGELMMRLKNNGYTCK